jgi:hypothetical protein
MNRCIISNKICTKRTSSWKVLMVQNGCFFFFFFLKSTYVNFKICCCNIAYIYRENACFFVMNKDNFNIVFKISNLTTSPNSWNKFAYN